MVINLSFRHYFKSAIFRAYYYYMMLLMLHQVFAQGVKRKLVVDPDMYTTKTVSEYFLSNPVTFFIMIWMMIHVFLGIMFFCFLASERSMMKPTSVTL